MYGHFRERVSLVEWMGLDETSTRWVAEIPGFVEVTTTGSQFEIVVVAIVLVILLAVVLF